MKVTIFFNESAQHQKAHAYAMSLGLSKHGIRSSFSYQKVLPTACDVAVVWGYKPLPFIRRLEAQGSRLLLMERGYFPDRMLWTVLSWDGLNNRGKLPECLDQGQRLESNWPNIIKPWNEGGHYVLVCGQLPGDAALQGMNIDRWARGVTDILVKQHGKSVRYRPHPWLGSIQRTVCPVGAELSVNSSLEQDLAGAEFCVTFNSNSGVDSILAGVPTVTLDKGAMSWSVASHALSEPLVKPDRYAWANKLAWCQWKMSEIAGGDAWAVLREIM